MAPSDASGGAAALRASREVRCVYVNVEFGQTAREDVAAGMRAILGPLAPRGAPRTRRRVAHHLARHP